MQLTIATVSSIISPASGVKASVNLLIQGIYLHQGNEGNEEKISLCARQDLKAGAYTTPMAF